MLKRIMTIVALMCAVAFQVNAQEADNGEALKKAEEKALKADKNKKDAKLQLDAAYALAQIAQGDSVVLDRAMTYVNRALEMGKAQKEMKDTLMAKCYLTIGNIYLQRNDREIGADYLEKAVRACEDELGRFDPVTVGIRLSVGRSVLMAIRDTRRGFLHVLQAFYDNDMMPEEKRIKNMAEMNIEFSWAFEGLLADHSFVWKNALPVFSKDGQRYLIVQTPQWSIGHPLVGWMTPNVEKEDGVIIVNDNTIEFKHLTDEERANFSITWDYVYHFDNPYELQISEQSTKVMFFNDETYNFLLQRYREFKEKERNTTGVLNKLLEHYKGDQKK